MKIQCVLLREKFTDGCCKWICPATLLPSPGPGSSVHLVPKFGQKYLYYYKLLNYSALMCCYQRGGRDQQDQPCFWQQFYKLLRFGAGRAPICEESMWLRSLVLVDTGVCPPDIEASETLQFFSVLRALEFCRGSNRVIWNSRMSVIAERQRETKSKTWDSIQVKQRNASMRKSKWGGKGETEAERSRTLTAGEKRCRHCLFLKAEYIYDLSGFLFSVLPFCYL